MGSKTQTDKASSFSHPGKREKNRICILPSIPYMDVFNVQDNQANIVGPNFDLLMITKNKAEVVGCCKARLGSDHHIL